MEILRQSNELLRAMIAWIGNTEILGITLDIPAHILAGGAIFYFLAVRRLPAWAAYLVVFALSLLKEYYDFSAVVHTGRYLEPLKDIVFTMLGAAIGHYLSRPVNKS